MLNNSDMLDLIFPENKYFKIYLLNFIKENLYDPGISSVNEVNFRKFRFYLLMCTLHYDNSLFDKTIIMQLRANFTIFG